MSASVLAAVLFGLVALVWLILAQLAWRGWRELSLPLAMTAMAGVVTLHYGLHVVSMLVSPAARASRLGHLLGVVDQVGLVLVFAVLHDGAPLSPTFQPPPRSRRWIAANFGVAAVVSALIVVRRQGTPAAGVISAVEALYFSGITLLVARAMARSARRGRWRPGSLGETRSADVALISVGAALCVAGGLLARQGDTRVSLALDGALGLVFASFWVVRMLGEVVRRFLLLGMMLAAVGGVYFGLHALAAGATPEGGRLIDVGAVLALVLLLGPGQDWLRDGFDRVLFRRSRRRRDGLRAFLQTLAPEEGVAACCRRALTAAVRIMELRGAAILLRDGDVLADGDIECAALVAAWPRGTAADALPRRRFDAEMLSDAALREALGAAEVSSVVPLLSPRRRWGHLFVTTSFLGSTAFLDEDIQTAEDFAIQLARVLDAADLLARAVAVERSLAHAEKLAAIGELAARVAHEIRNPVTAARSLAQQLARGPEAEAATLVVAELDRVERQVAALLRFARRDELRLVRVDLCALVDETLAAFRRRAVAATLSASVNGPVVARADREKLRQVLVNLVENALDAGAGAIVAAVGATNGTAAIELRDDGAGVPAAALPRLFDPFFSTKATGTGLGLAIARRTVEAHGGRITATSAPGAGATFRIELPLAGEDG
ncbi:MAG TPA: ATP-binding protein [Candidatus Binatia bacterium]|nr:ATP-binding protein [Candidatus Binatia bacterium]